jgi:hypothetical protein
VVAGAHERRGEDAARLDALNAVRPSPARLLLLGLGGIALLAGLAGATVLLGVPMPAASTRLAAPHGILMTLGFLGTLIALERAVALGRWWGYGAPLAAGLGGLALLGGQPDIAGWLLVVAAATYVGMYVAFDRIERSLHGTVQGVGGAAWFGAALLLLLLDWSPREAHPWLAAFLVLTIAGERLELSRLGQLTAGARRSFVAAALVFAGGIGITLVSLDAGIRIGGIGLVLLAAWLARHDLARRTVRMRGVTRFVALSLLAGYAWLTIAGMGWLAFGASPPVPAYDAMLHALFLGFVISMVFGHAPIILPAVLRLPLPYHPRFYVHLALLHAGLLLRVGGGDVLGIRPLWVIGGLLGVTALLVFVASSAAAVVAARLGGPQPRSTPRRTAPATAPASAWAAPPRSAPPAAAPPRRAE